MYVDCIFAESVLIDVAVIASFIVEFFFFFLMIRRPPRSTHCISSAASDVYKRQYQRRVHGGSMWRKPVWNSCLLYTSDAADDMQCVDLGGRRIIKKKKKNSTINEAITATSIKTDSAKIQSTYMLQHC
eukprot:TRINITY_DN5715_c0_g1_i1.p1 TRINITY_DN5715_c0_g1~~TRINITY_DN5715_c0_g1_i1.p1  ORF type:complete len:129 (-),score=35.85 TRINITY_DN5715_c0_g1_i1:43-429(-)